MIKVSTTGMAVSLKTDLRFPVTGQQGHGGRIIHLQNKYCHGNNPIDEKVSESSYYQILKII